MSRALSKTSSLVSLRSVAIFPQQHHDPASPRLVYPEQTVLSSDLRSRRQMLPVLILQTSTESSPLKPSTRLRTPSFPPERTSSCPRRTTEEAPRSKGAVKMSSGSGIRRDGRSNAGTCSRMELSRVTGRGGGKGTGRDGTMGFSVLSIEWLFT
jgi:hypothetical protein